MRALLGLGFTASALSGKLLDRIGAARILPALLCGLACVLAAILSLAGGLAEAQPRRGRMIALMTCTSYLGLLLGAAATAAPLTAMRLRSARP